MPRTLYRAVGQQGLEAGIFAFQRVASLGSRSSHRAKRAAR